MTGKAHDDRGYLEVVPIDHVNVWSTYSALGATAVTASKIVNSVSGSNIFITDMSFYAGATACNFTLLENTATTKFGAYCATTTWSHHNLGSAIKFATSAGVHITTDGTAASVFLAGYYI